MSMNPVDIHKAAASQELMIGFATNSEHHGRIVIHDLGFKPALLMLHAELAIFSEMFTKIRIIPPFLEVAQVGFFDSR
jgi:hypothetical protein